MSQQQEKKNTIGNDGIDSSNSEINKIIDNLNLLNVSDTFNNVTKRIPVATQVALCLGFHTGTASAFQHHNCRQPRVIFRLASNLIVHHASSMSAAELYNIYEVGAQAALDLGHDNIASDWIIVLKNRFGKCPRVMRLMGLMEEAQGNSAKAMEHYERARQEFPNEIWPVKRLSALHKSKGRIGDAIAVLESRNVYVDKVDEKSYPFRQLHPLDDGALKELITLHWMNNSADKALFFAEELLLLDPHNFLFLSRVAELCYANGAFDRAISAYSQSVRLNPHSSNCRAVLGLWQSCLEWRRVNGNSNNNNNKGGKNNHNTNNVDDIDDNNSNEVSSSTTQQHQQAPQMTLTLCNNLIQLSEARLREHYQNSPLCSVLELTLRRYGGK